MTCEGEREVRAGERAQEWEGKCATERYEVKDSVQGSEKEEGKEGKRRCTGSCIVRKRDAARRKQRKITLKDREKARVWRARERRRERMDGDVARTCGGELCGSREGLGIAPRRTTCRSGGGQSAERVE